MLWIFYSFGSGVLESAVNAFSKKVLQAQTDIIPIILLKFAAALPVYALMWIGLDGGAAPSSWRDFGSILVVLIIAEIGGQYYFHKALVHCPLTVVTPFQALIPVFMIPFAWFLLGEVPSLAGIFGIGIIAASVVLIGYEMTQQRRDASGSISLKGLGYLLAMSLFWSITSVLQKPAAQLSSPAFLGLLYLGGVALCLACLPGSIRSCVSLVGDKRLRWSLVPLLFLAPVGYLQYTALTYAHPSYVMSIKSSARLLNIFWDRHMFRERLSFLRICANILSIFGIIILLVFR